MAIQIVPFTVTIATGTTPAAPQTTSLAMGTAYVEKVRWRVPPGHNGAVGWYLAMGGVQVLPTGTGSYVIANDEAEDWAIDALPDSGAWQLVGYNTGALPHTVYLRFFIDKVPPAPPPETTPALLDATALAGG